MASRSKDRTSAPKMSISIGTSRRIVANLFIKKAASLCSDNIRKIRLLPLIGNRVTRSRSAYKVSMSRVSNKIAVASFERNLLTVHAYLLLMGQASLESFRLLLNPENLGCWQFWVFLYVSSCVSTHLAPSKQDMQISREGITSVIILVIIGNAIAAAFWFNPLAYTLYWGKFLGVILSLLGMTLSISLVICIVSHIIALPIRLLRSH